MRHAILAVLISIVPWSSASATDFDVYLSEEAFREASTDPIDLSTFMIRPPPESPAGLCAWSESDEVLLEMETDKRLSELVSEIDALSLEIPRPD